MPKRTFILSITLGNESMQTGSDIADALRNIADKHEHSPEDSARIVLDSNGNAVGIYEIATS